MAWAWILFTGAVSLAMVAPAGVARAADRYPVPYTFSANVIAEARHPGTPPPGSNDWTCRPSAAHPRPVVLVHGLLANMTDNWQTMSPLLANNGYCVFALTYGVPPGSSLPFETGGLNAMEQSAAELSSFVDRVLAATKAKQVDIVGHSEGATMPDYYLEYLGGAAKVKHYVGVSGVKHGTDLHGVGTAFLALQSLLPTGSVSLGSCASCEQFLVGSDYVQAIEARAPAAGVVYTNIATRYDELVSPYTSSFLSGKHVANITLQDHCRLDASDHLSIISSPITGQLVLNALDPAHARPAPCVPVLPAA
jgi:triacylglycerol esterase/lipase EstA (alpha/beta hydrolase family)